MAALVYHGVSGLQRQITLNQSAVFEVSRGESLQKVAERLKNQAIIRSSFWFYWVARFYKIDRDLKAGEYQLLAEYSERDLYALLTSGKSVEYSLRFIEGWTLKDVLAELDNHPKLSRKVDNSDPVSLAAMLNISQNHAEGMIFPDTYAYHKGMSDLDILRNAHQRMLSTLEQLWPERAPEAVVSSPYEALILASIIEKETGDPSERGLISGVFSARLKKGMRLQTDPTVIYGLGESFSGNLTRAHLRQPTPYNTYVINSLPPTPIAMPGRAAIEAALKPELSGYLYFVARGDGTHFFSTNLREHNQAVRRYQINRRKDYRSN